MSGGFRFRRVRNILFLGVVLACSTLGLTVEKISLERMTQESALILHGHVLSSRSQWEGNNIFTYTQVRVRETVKGVEGEIITVKQMGGRVGDVAAGISGSPELQRGEEVVLFLTDWQGAYWIHSMVLGKFSVEEIAGTRVARNDLRNVGLIDPVTKRDVTDPSERNSSFPLEAFLAGVRSLAARGRN